MVNWQFWTLIGVVSAFGIYVVASLSALIDAVNTNNQWLGMCHEHLRNLVGIGASTGIAVEAIKYRTQRD